MSDYNGAKWKELFGEAWDSVIDVCTEIGGFLINHEEKTVSADKNAAVMAGVSQTPDYDSFVNAINDMKEQGESSIVTVSVISEDEKYTAGVFKSRLVSGENVRFFAPICDYKTFISALSQFSEKSLLALIEFSGGNNRELSEFHIFSSLNAAMYTAPKDTAVCFHSRRRFWVFVPDYGENDIYCLIKLQNNIRNFEQKNIFGKTVTTSSNITFSAGIGANCDSVEQRMETAEFALYEAKKKPDGSIVRYSTEQYERNKSDYEKMTLFMKLVNENLFIYHFQPIVSAKNGDIVAYEMLMRSDKSIGMFPLEILECAEKANRLYDIEAATIGNSLEIIDKSQEILKGKKLFVNSITAHMLTDEDWNALEEHYGAAMGNMVIEFTEQTEIDDATIARIKRRLGRKNIPIAIDDFGTGYSNTSNLIRYTPDYVKIDRALIEGISGKPKIRRLVSGFIEFIHENGYLVLAEGVETYEELQVMIQLGSDLIQGYYTAKPNPVMITEISESVRRDIRNIHQMTQHGTSRPYHPTEGEIVDLVLTTADFYNSVFVDTDNITIKGRSDMVIDTTISVKSGIKTRIVLDNVRMKSEREVPIVSIGENSEVELVIVDMNSFEGHGIYVPASSTLRITGGGEFKILANMLECFGIGNDKNNAAGNIFIEMSGRLYVEANGESSVAIGGGKCTGAERIVIRGGDISVACSGKKCVGIGTFDGNGSVELYDCKCSIEASAPDVVGIGSFVGNEEIYLKNYRLKENFNGLNITGVGVSDGGSGIISMESGSMNGVMKSKVVTCVGTRGGDIECKVVSSDVTLSCESGIVTGIGDISGSGDVYIENTGMYFRFLTGEGIAYGSKSGNVTCSNIAEKISINP